MTLIKKLITAFIATAPILALATEVQNVNDNKWGLNLSEGVTPFSQEIYDLHMIVLFIVTIIGIGVFGAMFYAMYAFRKSKGAQAEAWHENHIVEAIWTVIPLFILIGIAVPATEALIKMEDVSGSEMTVKVTGYQWMWQYDYVDSGLSMYSRIAESSNFARQRGSGVDPSSVENYLLEVDQVVVLPVDTKIRFLTTAADVIHAWWVPALGWKRDAIPGFINESWAKIEKTGIYRGQCAELCGKDHGFMPIVIKVVEKDEFDKWVALQLENTDTRGLAKN